MVNNRIRSVAPTKPYIFLHCPDATSVTATPTAIVWGCCPIKTSELHYKCGDDRVIIRRGGQGVYEISIALCVEKATGNPGHSVIKFYINGVVACCAETHGYMGAANQHSNATLLYTVYLSEGDYVQAFVSVNNGTGVIENDTGRFRMKMLSMKGWDNGAGGSAVSDRRK